MKEDEELILKVIEARHGREEQARIQAKEVLLSSFSSTII